MSQIGEISGLRVAFYHKDTGDPFVPTDTPAITVLDPTGAVVVNNAPMTQLGTSWIWRYEYTWAADGAHTFFARTADPDASHGGVSGIGMVTVGLDAPATSANIIAIPAPLDASETEAALAAALAAYDPPTKAELDSAIAGIAAPMTATQLRAALGMSAADLDAQLDALLAHFEAVVTTDAATGIVTVRNRNTDAVILTFKLTNADGGVPAGLASSAGAINRGEV